MRKVVTRVLAVVVVVLGAVGCGAPAQDAGAAGFMDGTQAVFRFQSVAVGEVVEGANNFSLVIKRKADDTGVAQAQVSVRVFMPAHAHDSPTTPVVTERGDGSYDVTNVSFSMPGDWEVTYAVAQAGQEDQATFRYTVQ